MRPKIAPLGVGDLEVLKLKLIGFEPGEIAHIETVMPFETRSRDHRHLRRTEETFREETEETEESVHEMKTTERFEIEQQSSEVQKEETKLAAGATIAAGYGPVLFAAYARYGSTESSEKSSNFSTNYAKEVTEKTLKRIVDQVRKERQTKTLDEVEEINKHAFHNTDGEPKSGIYRWVNKYYRAKVVNYGKRLWYEFIVGQPAAFYIYAQKAHLKHHVMPEEPEEPENPGKKGDRLKPEHIKRDNYQTLVKKYGADGVRPPPPEFIRMAKAIARDPEEGRDFAFVNSDLEIPEGYEWSGELGNISSAQNMSHRFHIGYAGGGWGFENGADGAETGNVQFRQGVSGIVPMAIHGGGIQSFSFTITVICRLSEHAFEAWQLDTFRSVMTAYQKLKQSFDEQVAEAQIREGVKITGRNPAINREIIMQELQKACITLWTGFEFDGLPLVRRAGSGIAPNDFPRVDVDNTLELIPEITFLHQAFDWMNMTFEFYPYIWAPRADWLSIYPLEDNDPLFSEFLRAGAARVLVPVQLEMTDVVLNYQLTGRLELNGDLPLFEPNEFDDDISLVPLPEDDDAEPETELALYQAYVEELADQDPITTIERDVEILADDPDTWIIEEPTSLVWLQPDGELPPIEDS